MRRGGIYLADLGTPIGHEQSLRRPVVLLSAQPWLDSNPSVVTVLPITRTYRARSTHVEVEPGTSGLSAVSYIRCEDIRAVSPLRLEQRFGLVDEIVLLKVELVLRRLLAL
ncbi:type II toxin-antitoxin system PemK/MazF family toxin [Paenarthrobacter sp. Z7-10]|uniref:type II toxin-antitoxin system PemK/MazF family toxin n=1 Tax=Paenarthrobacter sp. Z7-10 TaxID=2787635 RepID=UPI0022A9AB44|nr:type II toxin-antitoxin system PemK/MazF family toxin [Paenarthrobacter sp. Z7-10]MCZ2403891.1 type II toxin-antitoxin system PemK/MazF family toxin [Paenarthrobacter sp. Z7-10]